jgi:hypothetical protein
MVPSGLDGQRQLLRTGLRQGPGRYPQERLVSGWLARERQPIPSAEVYVCKRFVRAGAKARRFSTGPFFGC